MLTKTVYNAHVSQLRKMIEIVEDAPEGAAWQAWRAMSVSLIGEAAESLAGELATLAQAADVSGVKDMSYYTSSVYAALGKYTYFLADEAFSDVKELLDLSYNLTRLYEATAAPALPDEDADHDRDDGALTAVKPLAHEG